MPRFNARKYYFGRLNLIAYYHDKQGKHQCIHKGLTLGNEVEKGKHRWGFYDISLQKDDELGYMYSGFLVKLRPEYHQEVADVHAHTLHAAEIKNSVVGKAMFFLHVDSGLIAYNLMSSDISQGVFRERFCDTFEDAHEHMFVSAEIQTIGEEIRFLEVVRRFKAITSIKVKLHPSNPSCRDVWRSLDDGFKKKGIVEYNESFKIKPNNDIRSITEDEDVRAKLSMAQDGYGIAQVRGILDDKQKTISTQDSPVSVVIPVNIEKAEILPHLRAAFTDIFNRFLKKNGKTGEQ